MVTDIVVEKQFRDYTQVPDRVSRVYKANHEEQTVSLVLQKKKQYTNLQHDPERVKTVWEQLIRLNDLVDDSDPDISLSQMQHAFQCAEKAREDGKPRWFQLVCLIHDLGKVLYFYGEPQHLVVGDTFVVGCQFSPKVIYHEFFNQNPDASDGRYNSKFGIYEPNCGLDRVHMSWGHDEFLYHVVKQHLSPKAAYIIRYHSFYAYHQHREYAHLMNDYDRMMIESVREFNPYDLYSKSDDAPSDDDPALIEYYKELIDEFIPGPIQW